MAKRLRWIGLSALTGVFAIIAGSISAMASGNPVITYSPGNTSSWVMTDFGISDVSTNSTVAGPRSDAYDNAMNLSICSDASCTYTTGSYTPYSAIGTYDQTLQTYKGPTSVINGLTVSANIRLSTSIVAGRMLASFQNTSSSTISRVIKIYTNLGSDGSTSLKYTSSNQTLSNQTLPNTGNTNYWSITAQDAGLTSSAQAATDPLNTFVWGTPGAAVRGNANINNGDVNWTYTLNIPANTTHSVLFVFGLGEISSTSNTFAGALSGVTTYLDSYTKLPSDLTNDLSANEISSIQNWVIAPSPSSFTSTQATPTNSSNAISYSMTMSQAISGLSSADFSNAGTATNCSFSTDTSTGTSFAISISGCGEGTLQPQLLANSVLGSQTGPSVDSPATSIIKIDRTAPTISTVSVNAGNYSMAITPNMNFTVVFSESVTVTGAPRIPLTIGSASRYANFISLTDSKTATFRFTVTVDYNDIDLDGISVLSPMETNTGMISDLASNDMTDFAFSTPETTSVNVYQPPSAPTIESITANNTSLTIYFTAGAANGSSITNYKFSLNGGPFTALSPTDAVSPLTITGLTNGTSYSIQLKAVSNLGDGLASNSVSEAPTASATVSIFLTASATTAVKGTVITITAQVNQAGVVSFFWNGQRISGCFKKSATTSATCQWKPAVTGQWTIQALLDPTDPAYVNSYSQKLPVFILKRSGTR